MDEFLRFPHTPHLAWLGPGRPRGDKILGPSEVGALLAGEVVVEEKVDGANLGLSIDTRGVVRAQNRGTFLQLDALHGQWRPLKRWLAGRAERLADVLEPGLILFGEWCYAVHTIRYTKLPDWFLGFDVYDRASGAFWDVDRRNALAERAGAAVVPQLGRAHFDLDGVRGLLGPSRLAEGPAEGLYVRREAEGQLVARAKLVRGEFVQAIDEHWSSRTLEENQLAARIPCGPIRPERLR